ncbi:putative membrane protein [Anaplasma phagocytophilum str. ApWI1]|nr:putative membrane protein [Anaplasma phagocytophilum str. Webster]KJV62973.1 putative membrane protein [Anaplasma phagocytophilum str. NCH-1]KJV82398.1 putative membrane protein [Anaplasma phagocytophilum str. HGE2]KJV84863.1 putative membrane protein [Anaplasma phagocytophilum str. ApWI1]KJV86972.1 putative membrane protein [Anaplasma phagocytophilum str. ApNYW]KJV98205.1 putative membrane protein [Anaplasma phagocytophilum str. Annie]KJZ98649.1 putative membrane protein [Anaplasma phagoc
MLYRAALMGSVFSFVLSLGVILEVFTYRYGVKAIFLPL